MEKTYFKDRPTKFLFISSIFAFSLPFIILYWAAPSLYGLYGGSPSYLGLVQKVLLGFLIIALYPIAIGNLILYFVVRNKLTYFVLRGINTKPLESEKIKKIINTQSSIVGVNTPQVLLTDAPLAMSFGPSQDSSCIVLNERILSLNEELLKSIITHELYHVKTGIDVTIEYLLYHIKVIVALLSLLLSYAVLLWMTSGRIISTEALIAFIVIVVSINIFLIGYIMFPPMIFPELNFLTKEIYDLYSDIMTILILENPKNLLDAIKEVSDIFSFEEFKNRLMKGQLKKLSSFSFYNPYTTTKTSSTWKQILVPPFIIFKEKPSNENRKIMINLIIKSLQEHIDLKVIKSIKKAKFWIKKSKILLFFWIFNDAPTFGSGPFYRELEKIEKG